MIHPIHCVSWVPHACREPASYDYWRLELVSCKVRVKDVSALASIGNKLFLIGCSS
jgi:hypothetical protein